jgi:iron complex transport system ATP-binding protein
MILSIQGVEFTYPGRAILKEIRFSVEKGDYLAILGPNGVGKSTLLKCINKILKPQKGTIFIEKAELRKLSRLEVARKVGYVAQRSEGGQITVFDAVALGRKQAMHFPRHEQFIPAVPLLPNGTNSFPATGSAAPSGAGREANNL